MSASEHWIIGIHAVSELLKQRPGDVSRLMLQAGRQDKRLQYLRDLAGKAGVIVEELDKAGIDARVGSRHQGVAALCRTGIGALTESGSVERNQFIIWKVCWKRTNSPCCWCWTE